MGHSDSCLQSKHLGDRVVFYVWISPGISQSPNSLLVATNINLVVFYWLNTNIYRPQAPLNISPLPLRSRPHSLLVQGRKSWCLAEGTSLAPVSAPGFQPSFKTEPSTKSSSNKTQGKNTTKSIGLIHSQEPSQQQRLHRDVQGKMAIMIYGRMGT